MHFCTCRYALNPIFSILILFMGVFADASRTNVRKKRTNLGHDF